MHVLRNIDRDRFVMDFLVDTEVPADYDDEIISLGAKIIRCLDPKKPAVYARNFRAAYAEHGPYDIVHSHVQHFGGAIAALANRMGVPARIVHSHNDTAPKDAAAGYARRAYLRTSRFLIRKYATTGVAVSEKAATSLFGSDWTSDPRWRVAYCGVDLREFEAAPDPARVRASLGIPVSALVVGHVGRFAEQKNHSFLLDIFAELRQLHADSRLLLVGEGPLLESVRLKAGELDLSDHVVFTGSRSDVAALMLGAMDVFVMPSFHEGLPLVGIEAQAAGLPLVLSDRITREMDILSERISRLSLSSSPGAWAREILEQAERPRNHAQSLFRVKQSPLSIQSSLEVLTSMYEGSVS